MDLFVRMISVISMLTSHLMTLIWWQLRSINTMHDWTSPSECSGDIRIDWPLQRLDSTIIRGYLCEVQIDWRKAGLMSNTIQCVWSRFILNHPGRWLNFVVFYMNISVKCLIFSEAATRKIHATCEMGKV